ncbi:MAG: sigma-54-dependent Fis family transcriptional regulator [Candidatus Schekmanbacteria bacterium]|nr:sigma-54-dependent Fis family transcriptional regulator [Candidatus Schekmanbacteria bacterium]
MKSILLVGNEPDMHDVCAAVLRQELTADFGEPDIVAADTAANAREWLLRKGFHLIVMELQMPGVADTELLDFAIAQAPGAAVVVVASIPSLQQAVAAIKRGAADYLDKPFSAQRLAETARKALSRAPLATAPPRPASTHDQAHPALARVLGNSEETRRLRALVSKLRTVRENVLILGETGVGKGLVAEIIHETGPTSGGPFMVLDCASIPPELMESEIFGHERGAFTGANSRHCGILESAGQGTLFLDEIGELPLTLQPKLLRVLQERQYRRLGGTAKCVFEARLIAATNRDLAEQMQERRFRQDLYYRLNVIPVHVPPLRERRADVEILARHFVQEFNQNNPHHGPRELGADAIDALSRCDWPGNVRQLANVVRRVCSLSPNRVLNSGDMPPEVLVDRGVSPPPAVLADSAADFFATRDQHLRDFEERYFQLLLGQTGGNVVGASNLSGIPRPTLYRYLRKYGLEPDDYRS